LNENRERLIERLLEEHKWVEGVALKYLQNTLTYYITEEVDYKKYINSFIRIVEEELLLPHHKFEEEEVFPLLPDDPLIQELINEHREIEELITRLKQGEGEELTLIRQLVDIIDKHLKKENTELITKLKGEIKSPNYK